MFGTLFGSARGRLLAGTVTSALALTTASGTALAAGHGSGGGRGSGGSHGSGGFHSPAAYHCSSGYSGRGGCGWGGWCGSGWGYGLGVSLNLGLGSVYYGSGYCTSPVYRSYCAPSVIYRPYCAPVYVSAPVVYSAYDTVPAQTVIVQQQPSVVQQQPVYQQQQPAAQQQPQQPAPAAPQQPAAGRYQDRDLGDAYMRVADFNNASRVYNRYLSAWNGDGTVTRNLGFALIGKGDIQDGFRAVIHGYQLEPNLFDRPAHTSSLGGTYGFQALLDNATRGAAGANTPGG